MHPNQEKVAQWMKIFGQEVHEKPHPMSKEVARLRIRLHTEELLELQEAVLENNLVNIADAGADLEYVLQGTACACGVSSDVLGTSVGSVGGLSTAVARLNAYLAVFNESTLTLALKIGDAIVALRKYLDSMCIPWQRVFDIVHFNNMEKFWTTSQVEQAFGLNSEELSKSTFARFGVLIAQRPDLLSIWSVSDKYGKVVKPLGFRPVTEDLIKLVNGKVKNNETVC